jgi:hypothetical protein
MCFLGLCGVSLSTHRQFLPLKVSINATFCLFFQVKTTTHIPYVFCIYYKFVIFKSAFGCDFGRFSSLKLYLESVRVRIYDTDNTLLALET